MRRPRLAGLWRHADFLWFWAAQAISLFGSEITYLELPLLGLFFAVGSVSALLASLFGARVARRLGAGPTVSTSVLMSVGWLGVPLAAGPTPVLVATMVSGGFLSSFGNTTYNLTVASIRQAATPDRLLDRVGAADLFVGYGLPPIGALLGGTLACGSACGRRCCSPCSGNCRCCSPCCSRRTSAA